LVFSNRTRSTLSREIWSRENPILWWIVLGGSAGLAFALSIPLLRDLFHFSGDLMPMLGVGLLAATSIFVLSAAVKRMLIC